MGYFYNYRIPLCKHIPDNHENPQMQACERYLFVVKCKGIYTAKEMCRVLHLSESGYYRWLRNRDRYSSRQLLAVKIKEILAEHPDNHNYGVDRIRMALEQAGVDVSRRTVYRVMKENGWLHKKRIPHGITKTTTEAQEQENLLKRDFSARRPLEKFPRILPRYSA